MTFTRVQKFFGIFGITVVFLTFMFWLLCLNHTSINEIGVAYNSKNGDITVQETPGWYLSSPLVRVAYISTLPLKVTIPSEAKVIVTKIVRFRPEGVTDFIAMQGFSYSLNSELQNVLRGYAFSGNTYSFLEIMQETTDENVTNVRKMDINEDNSKNK